MLITISTAYIGILQYLTFLLKLMIFLLLSSNKPIMMVLHRSWCQIGQGKLVKQRISYRLFKHDLKWYYQNRKIQV